MNLAGNIGFLGIISNVIEFIIKNNIHTIILLVVALIEITQARKARDAELLYKVFDEIHSSELLSEINWFEGFIKDNHDPDYPSIPIEIRRRIDRIIDTFTRISYLCEKRIISKKHVLRMYSALFMKVWDDSQKYIEKKRNATGIQNYACYFETMKECAKKYRNKHQIGTEILKDSEIY